jgi:peptide/nickel transport system substrate-binding protein
MRRKRLIVAVSLAAAGAVVLAACSSSKSSGDKGGGTGGATSGSGGGGGGVSAAFNAAVDNVVNPSTKTGGTIKLGATSDCDSFDPKIAYYGWCINLNRLYSRGLIGYSKVNGDKFTLAGDLATDLGKSNADKTEWTYTIKDGVKWENGKPVTAMDVKYGVERDWAAAELPGGPFSYMQADLKAPSTYKGPYKDGDLPATSIKVTGNTITFFLKKPDPDFNYVLSLPSSAAVPYKTEGGPGFVGATYVKHPMSSGPFKFKSYSPGKSVVWVRNDQWSQSTDTIRHPLASEIDLTIDTNAVDLDNKLDSGELDANAAGGAGGLTPAFKTKVLTSPDLKKNVDDPATPSTQYLPVMQTVITNVHCRRAIFYATNKASILNVYGGATSGQIAGSMTPPGIAGYQQLSDYDPYSAGSDQTGDLAKAKSELQQCGKPNGFTTNFGYPTPGNFPPKVFAAEKAALARVGIQINAVTDDSSKYYNTFIGSPENIKKKGIGIALAGWGADFPTNVGFYNAIANGKSIVDPGNSNYPSLNDPTVNKALDGGATTDADWQAMNHAIMDSAVYVPLYWTKTLYYRNPEMTNVTCNNALAFGIYDFVNIGIK